MTTNRDHLPLAACAPWCPHTQCRAAASHSTIATDRELARVTLVSHAERVAPRALRPGLAHAARRCLERKTQGRSSVDGFSASLELNERDRRRGANDDDDRFEFGLDPLIRGLAELADPPPERVGDYRGDRCVREAPEGPGSLLPAPRDTARGMGRRAGPRHQPRRPGTLGSTSSPWCAAPLLSAAPPRHRGGARPAVGRRSAHYWSARSGSSSPAIASS
jgi:hypothetical protein